MARVLARERGYEHGVVARVAPPQPPRLAREPVAPLEAGALHPVRRLRDEPGVEIERRADADEQRRVEVRARAEHPQLLLGLTGADPHDARAGGVDRLERALVLALAELAERRREAPGEDEPGETLAQARFEQLERVRRAAPV